MCPNDGFPQVADITRQSRGDRVGPSRRRQVEPHVRDDTVLRNTLAQGIYAPENVFEPRCCPARPHCDTSSMRSHTFRRRQRSRPPIDDALGDFRWAVEAIEGPLRGHRDRIGRDLPCLRGSRRTPRLGCRPGFGGLHHDRRNCADDGGLATRPPPPRCTDSARRLAGGSMIRLEGSSPFLFVNVIRTD
jgi:hypothetical protein